MVVRWQHDAVFLEISGISSKLQDPIINASTRKVEEVDGVVLVHTPGIFRSLLGKDVKASLNVSRGEIKQGHGFKIMVEDGNNLLGLLFVHLLQDASNIQGHELTFKGPACVCIPT